MIKHIYRIRRDPVSCKAISNRKYRKQVQHIRKYRSGRWTCVNRGVRYQIKPHPKLFELSEDEFKKIYDEAGSPEILQDILDLRKKYGIAKLGKNPLAGLTLEQKEEYLRKARGWQKKWYANLTQEQKEEYLRKARERQKERYANLTQEQKEEYKKYLKEWSHQHKK